MKEVQRCALLVLGLFSALPATAQVTNGDIVGRITDASGGVLPGVLVTAKNSGTGGIRTQTTTATGDYVFNLLPIGTYEVKIELPGFQTQTSRITLDSGDRARVDARLAVGALTESIQVTTQAALLQTDSARVSTLLTEKAVQDLPVKGRNITRLVQLVPGASEGPTSSVANGTRPDDRRQTSAVSINCAGNPEQPAR